jgi:single-stranded DNA-specific DHH superfamily exonuclease
MLFEPLEVIHEGWNQVLQTPVNVDILTSFHESRMFLMASRMVNLFQKVFYLLCPDPSEESLSMAAVDLRNAFLK